MIISQLVLAMAFLKWTVSWNSEFNKNYLTSIMFCFAMMSLVISQQSHFRLAKIRQKESSQKVLFIC